MESASAQLPTNGIAASWPVGLVLHVAIGMTNSGKYTVILVAHPASLRLAFAWSTRPLVSVSTAEMAAEPARSEASASQYSGKAEATPIARRSQS
jgi:hypothetical protein